MFAGWTLERYVHLVNRFRDVRTSFNLASDIALSAPPHPAAAKRWAEFEVSVLTLLQARIWEGSPIPGQ